MVIKINELEGVSAAIGDKLKSLNLNNSDRLLAAAAQVADRDALAEKLGIAPRAILELANRADLCRIKGVGRVYSDLLEFSGVDTVKELAQRNSANLYATIMEHASAHKVVRPPSQEDVENWIAQAKTMGRAVFY